MKKNPFVAELEHLIAESSLSQTHKKMWGRIFPFLNKTSTSLLLSVVHDNSLSLLDLTRNLVRKYQSIETNDTVAWATIIKEEKKLLENKASK